MKSFNAAAVSQLRQEIDAALEAVLKKHGLKKAPTTLRYSSNSVRYPLELLIVSENTTTSDNLIQNGIALPGTRVSVLWSDGARYTGTIIKRAVKYYSIEFDGEEGTFWKIPFRSCSAI